ncbi:MAG: S41 family peptidase [Bacteroidota bacterium]
MIRTLCSLVLLHIGFFSFGQNERVFTKEQLQEDFKFLYENIKTYNAGIGYFHPVDEFDSTYDSLFSLIDREMTDLQFYPYLVKLAESTREGHTSVGVSYDTISSIYRGFLQNEFEYFPLSIKYINDTMYVWGNFSPDSTLRTGDQILTINGESTAALMTQLESYIITDGDIKVAKTVQAASNFNRYYYWFIDQPDNFQITWQNDSIGTPQTLTIPAITRDSMFAWIDKRYERSQPKGDVSDVYEFSISGKTATLTLKTFVRRLMEQYEIKPKKLYAEIFQELNDKGVENLIIDVRGNTGGRREYAWELLPYLMKSSRSGVIYQDVSWKGKASNNKFPKPNKLAFKGQLYVLTDAVTFSNGSVVTAYAQEFGDAIVIGEETASRFEGFVAGSRQNVTLPNTKIIVRIPRYLLKNVYPNSKHKFKNRGVIPDYPIAYTFGEIRQRKDKQMEKALELIEATVKNE